LLLAAFLFFRTEATDVASADALQEMLRSGKPVMVEFYSNT